MRVRDSLGAALRLAACTVFGLAFATSLPAPAGAQALLSGGSRFDPIEQGATGTPGASDATNSSQVMTAHRDLGAVSQAGPVDPARYLLGPGDILKLELWGRLMRSAILEVSPEGKIFVLGFGPVQVAGHTLEWARAYVTRAVEAQFRDVNSDLRLMHVRTFKVYVSGSVGNPGAFQATPVTRASEIVALASPLPDASRRNIVVRRRDGRELATDLQLFASTGRQDLDPELEDGDVLVIPPAMAHVSAIGAVMRPGRFDFAPGDSLSTLIALAGGFSPAVFEQRALLVRFSAPSVRESLWLEVSRIRSGEVNPALRDGDHFYAFYVGDFHQVPSVSIYGEIRHPGTYPITLGSDRLSHLLRSAGGFLPLANQSALYLTRLPADSIQDGDAEFERLVRLSRLEMTESEYATFRTKLSERKSAFRVDATRLGAGAGQLDALLRPGDIVRVDPQIRSVRVEGEVRRPGMVEYEPGRDAGRYIGLAGGFTDRAARGAVRVSRSLTGQVTPARSVRSIEPGDFIWVPERKDVDAWQVFRDIIAVAGQVAVIVIAIRK